MTPTLHQQLGCTLLLFSLALTWCKGILEALPYCELLLARSDRRTRRCGAGRCVQLQYRCTCQSKRNIHVQRSENGFRLWEILCMGPAALHALTYALQAANERVTVIPALDSTCCVYRQPANLCQNSSKHVAAGRHVSNM